MESRLPFGTVADITFNNSPLGHDPKVVTRRALYTKRVVEGEESGFWSMGSDRGLTDDQIEQEKLNAVVRTLAVFDPGSDEDCVRLLKAFYGGAAWAGFSASQRSRHLGAMRRALLDLVPQPRPVEPPHLSMVSARHIDDPTGRESLWVRTDVSSRNWAEVGSSRKAHWLHLTDASLARPAGKGGRPSV